MRDRFNRSARTVYVCLDEIEGIRPRTEFAVGRLDAIKEASKAYEPANSPFVMFYLRDRENDNHGIVKVAIPRYHEDVSKGLLDYMNEVRTGLLDYMKQQNPDCELREMVSVHGSDDNVVLNMLKKYVKAEELVKYKV